MADDFLKNVIAQREREQEERVLRTPAVALPKESRVKQPQEAAKKEEPTVNSKEDVQEEEVEAEGVAAPLTQAKTGKRLCPGCSKPLRVDNHRGVCAKCINKGTVAVVPTADAAEVSADSDIRRQFQALCVVLGISSQKQLNKLMEDWVKMMRERILKVGDL